LRLLLSQAAQVTVPSGVALTLAPRDAAVLAWLALEGPTPRARLAALLWPDSDTEAARNSLRQRLHKLRKAVGAELISGETTLALAEGVSHDLHESDTVLGHGAHDYGPEFSAWLAQQRERRNGRLRRTLTELADMAERSGDHADGLGHAQELLALEPQSEAAHRRVMRLHYLRGDRAAALLAFDRCEQVLKDEVGARPSAETLALLATIERAAPDAVLQPAATVPAALQRPPRLIGRDAECRALARAVDAGGVLLLTGQAGMGKSRLIAELVGGGAAPADASRCVSVCARPGDAAVPYAVAARWLRGLALRPDIQLDAVQRGDLACVLPELGPPSARARQDDRTRLLAAMTALLGAAAQQGLRAVIVDDLQFADAPSVELLHALAGNTPCAWIIAMRPDELGPVARELVQAHAASTTTLKVPLEPLGTDAIAALLDSLAIEGIGGLAQAQVLRQRTGGNPMFLLETLKAVLASRAEATLASRAANNGGDSAARTSLLAWPRAESVQRLIQQRLTRLGPLALKLARCAALAGQDFSSPLAAEVLGLQPLDLADAWAELEDAQVLDDGAFAHDLIAEAALGLVPKAIARALHAEIGRILERSGGEPARIAAHWLAAGEPRKAAPHLSAAARRAHAAWQRAEAAVLHEQAAIILREAGDRRGAFDAYFAAAEAASQSVGRVGFAAFGQALQALADDDGQRAAAALVPAAILLEERQLDTMRQLVLEALPRAQRADLPDIEVELLWDLTMVHLDRGELAEGAQRAEQALARLADVDPATARLTQVGTRFKLSQALGSVLAATGQYAKCDAMLMQTLQQARQDREWAYTGFVANALSGNALEQGDLERALAWSAQAIADEDRYDGGLHERVEVGNHRATLLALKGDLGGALAAAERAVRLCEPLLLRIEACARKRLHTLHFELGRRDLALKGLHDLRGRAGLRPHERIALDVDLLCMGDGVDAASLLEQVNAIDDFPLRVRMLCLLQPACEPLIVLPLLSAAAATARSYGAHGLWLTLQTRRVAALRAAGRLHEAQVQALAVWQRSEEGIAGLEMFPRMAAELRAALAEAHVDLVQTIALRASAWMQQAAATLPAAWRENYLRRAPILQTLRPATRGRLLSPPTH
jgi:DNA-binding SARP family transcriptional activator